MNRIKELRKELRMSQRQLAEIAGVSQQQIQRIETGKSDTTFEVTKRICSALGQSRIRDVFPETVEQYEAKEAKIVTRQQLLEGPELVDRFLSADGPDFLETMTTVRFFLLENKCVEINLQDNELVRLNLNLTQKDRGLRYVIFTSPQVKIALNATHVVAAEFYYDAREKKAPPVPLDEISHEKVTVISPEFSAPLLLEVDPDIRALDDDFAEEWETQLQDVFFWAEEANDQKCAVISLGKVDRISTLIRLDRISFISVPLELINPRNFVTGREGSPPPDQ